MRPFGSVDFRQALEIGHGLAQLLDDRVAFAIDERLQLFPRGLLRAGHLPRADLLLARADLHADLGQRGDGLGHGGRLPRAPSRCRWRA